MAIPKVSGIENEFGFAIFNQENKQLLNQEYHEAVLEFVMILLNQKERINFDSSQESRWLPNEKETEAEKKHRLEIEKYLHRANSFLQNGARFYLDGHHPEYSTPECLNPLDLVAHDKASELTILEAIKLFKAREKNKQYKLFIHKSNSDGEGHSYGCHLNVLLDGKVRKDMAYFIKRYIPFQIARLILIGSGKIGAENERNDCEFQISQRADFFTCLTSPATTENRPIFNLRDEPHASKEKYFRLHDISTDALLCEQAIFLKVALSQIVLAMIEDGFIGDELFPENPIKAIRTVSRDLSFNRLIVLKNGNKMTGMEMLRWYLEKCENYLKENPMTNQHEKVIKDAYNILDILEKDISKAFGKLDWATAWTVMKTSNDPEVAKMNLLKLREMSPDSLFKKFEKSGLIHRLVNDNQIKNASINPPTDTRAYLRGQLIKKLRKRIIKIGWSNIFLDFPEFPQIKMNDPAEVVKDIMDMLILRLESLNKE